MVGVGVVFKVVFVLLEELFVEFLDLVVIGIIVDLVLLIDENWIFVLLGIDVIYYLEWIGF